MVLVSVISATYNRAKLLDNALLCYSKQTMPFSDWEYLICDDMSQDDTRAVVEKWKQRGLPLRYFTAADLGHPKVPGQWRDGCKLRNAVSTHAFGRVLIATHPEILVPPNALQVMHDTAIAQESRAWVTAIPYWLPDSPFPAGWEDDVMRLREAVGFYDPNWPDPLHSPGAPDYTNQNQERRSTWESEVFFAMKTADWRWIGGFREFDAWGSVDMDFLSRRAAIGIKTVIAKGSRAVSGNLMVFHQYHESKRDMTAAVDALKGSTYTPQSSREMGGLHVLYNHGHRERATHGGLMGVMGDHVERYRFALRYSQDKVVLDAPCGTGYGREVITNAKRYIGVDIDAESVDFAAANYRGAEWKVGDLTSLPVETGSVDLLVSFEGIEHVEDQRAFVREMHRVLRKRGTFILSTPQRGAARGTPWDRFMLTTTELYGLFAGDEWTGLDWFYQLHYGGPAVPVCGMPPKDAEIIILGGTCI